MAYETIKYEVDEQILTITLNRPDKLNAFNAAMQKELIEAFDAADKDDNVRAIIVTGAGRGFCAGADLSSGADARGGCARSSLRCSGRAFRSAALSVGCSPRGSFRPMAGMRCSGSAACCRCWSVSCWFLLCRNRSAFWSKAERRRSR